MRPQSLLKLTLPLLAVCVAHVLPACAASPTDPGSGNDAGSPGDGVDASQPSNGNGNGSSGGAGNGSSSGSAASSGSSSGSSSSSGGNNGGNSSGGGGSGSGSSSGGSSSGSSSGVNANDCASQAGLTWKSANETVFESYPPAGSVECIQYSGCMYEGQFQDCSNTMPVSWVDSHNIVSVFPDSDSLAYHALCLKDPSSGNSIVVVALDTCADSDCSGCCTQNQGNADELIDVEINTDARFMNLGINGGAAIQWADLGMADPSTYSGCN